MMKSATLMDPVSKDGTGKNTGLMQLEENGQNVNFMDVEIKRRSELMCMWRGGITPSSCQLVGDVTQILYWITMETRQFGFLPNLTVLLSGLRHTQLQENNSYIRDALKNGLFYDNGSILLYHSHQLWQFGNFLPPPLLPSTNYADKNLKSSVACGKGILILIFSFSTINEPHP